MLPLDALAPVVLATAFVLDGTLGEPPLALHPVCWMGNAIAPLKRLGRRTKLVELALGGGYVLVVTSLFALGSWLVLALLAPAPWLAALAAAYLLWSCFALKGLCAAGDEMDQALAAGDLARARRALTSLCSRDPSTLTAEELAGATVESLTENASDSVVAPLFYFALFGVPGAVLYRAANTLDAMVGYRGRYEYLGKVAARLDDLLNLVPARLTALLLGLAGALLRLDVRRGVRVCLRDRARTESPNAGWPMAMAAGLLGVRLDKRDAYVLGEELAAPDARALRRALRLVRATGFVTVLALALVLGGRHV